MSDRPLPQGELSPERRARIFEQGRARRRQRQLTRGAVALTLAVVVLVPLGLSLSRRHPQTIKSTGNDNLFTVPTTVPGPVTTRPPVTTVPPPASTSTTLPPSTTTTPSTTPAVAPDATRVVGLDTPTLVELARVFAAAKGYSPDEIDTTTFGNPRGAYAPITQSSWAMVSFQGTKAMTFQHGVDMQDGGNIGIFARPDGGAWRLTRLAGEPYPCHALPPDVEQVWRYEPTTQWCGQVLDVPVGGSMNLVLGADGFLYPAGWTVTHLHQVGSLVEASAADPHGSGRITVRLDPTVPQSVLWGPPDKNGHMVLDEAAVLAREHPCAGASASGRAYGSTWAEFGCSVTSTVAWGEVTATYTANLDAQPEVGTILFSQGPTASYPFPEAIFQAFASRYPQAY